MFMKNSTILLDFIEICAYNITNRNAESKINIGGIMHDFEYVGCFFDYGELAELVAPIRKNALKNDKPTPHVTFEYKPDTVLVELFGTAICATATGYGNNGENEGLKVVLSSDNEIINRMSSSIEVPHITLAVSDTGQAVNTRYLDFEPIAPIKIVGWYGGYKYREGEK